MNDTMADRISPAAGKPAPASLLVDVVSRAGRLLAIGDIVSEASRPGP